MGGVVLLDVRVDPAVAGSAIVTAGQLQQGLGSSALRLWQVMLGLRHPRTGELAAWREDLERPRGFVPQSAAMVAKSMRRLLASGLVEVLGWDEKWGRPVLLRRVRGAASLRDTRGQAMFAVPPLVSLWIRKQLGWGGSRQGAGRTPVESFTYSNSYTNTESRFSRPPLPGGNQDSPAYKEGSSLFSILVDPKRSPKVAASSKLSPEPPAVILLEEVCEVGSLLGSTRTSKPVNVMSLVIRGLVPAAPGHTLIPRVTVPGPLHLDHMSDGDASDYVMRVWQVLQRDRFNLSRKFVPAAKSKHQAAVLAAVVAMREHHVSPAAWLWWSCDRWRGSHATKKPPPFAWAISATRIETRAGWCRKEMTLGGQLVYPRALTVLVQKWDELRRKLILESEDGLLPDARIRTLVGELLPERKYEALVEQARTEIRDAAETYRSRLARGEWIW